MNFFSEKLNFRYNLIVFIFQNDFFTNEYHSHTLTKCGYTMQHYGLLSDQIQNPHRASHIQQKFDIVYLRISYFIICNNLPLLLVVYNLSIHDRT